MHERDTTIDDITNPEESFKTATDFGPARVLPTVIFNDAEDSRELAHKETRSPKAMPMKELIPVKDIYPEDYMSSRDGYSNRDTTSDKPIQYSVKKTGKENRGTRAITSARNRPNSSRPRSNSRSTATPRKETPERGSSAKNRSMRRKAADESCINTGKKLNSSTRKRETGLNLQNIPNLKYEVEKLLRAVFRHSVKCTQLKEDLRKMGGSKLFDEYVRCRETALSWK